MKLSEEQITLLKIGKFDGPRPGSNLWAFVELQEALGTVAGEVCDEMIRSGLFRATPRQEVITLKHGDEYVAECDVDIEFEYDITDAGLKALEEAS